MSKKTSHKHLRWSQLSLIAPFTKWSCHPVVNNAICYITQLSNLWWISNSVCMGFSTAMRTGSSRRFKRYPTAYMWVSSWLHSTHTVLFTCRFQYTACRWPKFPRTHSSAALLCVAVAKNQCEQILATIHLTLYAFTAGFFF